MTIVTYIIIGLLALKILWNLTVPYDLAWKAWRARGQKVGGISLMPYLEVGLLALAIGVAALSNGPGWFESPKKVAIWGGSAIVISYVHMVVVGMTAGWILTRLKKSESQKNIK